MSTGFALALVLVAGVEWLGWRHSVRAGELAALLTRTHEMRDARARLFERISELDVRYRNLRGDAKLPLKELEDALVKIAGDQRALEEETLDPEQKANAAALNARVAEWAEEVRGGVEARGAAPIGALPKETPSGPRNSTADEVRARILTMEQRGRELVTERSRAAAQEARQARALMATGSALTIGLLTGVWFLLRRENQLRQRAQEELDRFFSVSLDMLCISSADGYFKRVSPAFTGTLGWSVEEILATPYLDLVHPDDAAATLNEVKRQVDAGEKVLQFENRYRHKDGTWRVLSWKSVPQPGGLMYATARDITERKRREEEVAALNAELRKQAAQLQTANEQLESFAYSVSHDLRAPLRGIDGFSEAVLQDYSAVLDAKGKDYLGRVRKAAQRMGQLIDDLLDLSRVTRADMVEDEIDLSSLARRVARELESRTPGRRVEWRIDDHLRARGDARLMQIVLENLLSNALKFTGARENAVVVIGGQADATPPVFFVRDNGVGFDMAHAGKIFGAFQRLHSAQEFPGTGIGLATVQRIIHRHGGQVRAEAQPGAGTTISFTLPSAQAAISDRGIDAEP